MRRPAPQHDTARRAVAFLRGPHAARLAKLVAAAICLAAAAASAAGAEDLFVTGNAGGLWIVRPGAERTFDLAVRPVGKAWKIVTRDYPGAVLAAAAVEDHVHVLLANPLTHLIFYPDAQDAVQAVQPRDERWSSGARVLAAFEMADPNKAQAALIVVVAAPEHRAGTQPSSSPTRPAQSSRAERLALRAALSSAPTSLAASTTRLHVFRFAQGQWDHLAEYADAEISPRTRVLGAAADGMIYLSIAEALPHGPRLVRWNAGVWEDLPALPAAAASRMPGMLGASPTPATGETSATGTATATGLATAPAVAEAEAMGAATASPATAPAAPDTARIFAMVSLQGQPVLLRAVPAPAPARWQVQLATYAPKGAFLLQPVRSVMGTASWGEVDFEGNPLRAALLGNQIALLWRRQDRLQMGTVDLTGQFVPQESVTIFQPEASSGHGEEICDYFVLASLAISAVLAVYMRRNVPIRPFDLPPGVTPADPIRRLVAAVIDMFPMMVLAGAFVPVPPIPAKELVDMMKEGRGPDNLYIAVLGAVGLYVIYCVAMEYRFGMTLGKAILRIRVVGDRGQRATLPQLAMRNVLKIVEFLFPPSIPVLLMVPFLNRLRQRLGDMFARTVVVCGKPLPTEPGEGEADGAKDSGPDEPAPEK